MLFNCCFRVLQNMQLYVVNILIVKFYFESYLDNALLKIFLVNYILVLIYILCIVRKFVIEIVLLIICEINYFALCKCCYYSSFVCCL